MAYIFGFLMKKYEKPENFMNFGEVLVTKSEKNTSKLPFLPLF